MKRSVQVLAALVSAAAVSAFGVSGALADGHTSLKDAPAPRHTAKWTGFYVGGQAGWIGTEADWTFQPGGTNPAGNPFENDAGLFGGVVGYQHQLGFLVLGIEGTFSGLLDGDSSSACPNAAFQCTVDVHSIATVGGRIGAAIGSFMPYFTGGYAHANYETETNNGALVDPVDADADGFYVGGGIDWMPVNNLVFGIEYRHYDFDTEFSTSERVPGVDDRTIDLDADSVTARVTFLLK
ncbi:MAG: outer membrane beta-barrel protein [Pseudomonadota bacterium]